MSSTPWMVHDGALVVDGRAVERETVDGFVERYSPWTGVVWLEVVGPTLRLPVGDDYGALRRALRKAYPERPFTADWSDGRFPVSPAGLPTAWGAVAVVAAASLVVGGVTTVAGLGAGIGAALSATLPVGIALGGLQITREGVRAGAIWAPVVSWHRVDRIVVERIGRRARVLVVDASGARTSSVPTALLPALRARCLRLGGLHLEERTPTLDDRYAAMRRSFLLVAWASLMVAWGGAWMAASPWRWATWGTVAAAGAGALAAAVEARATGWRFGGVFWSLVAFSALWAAALGLLAWAP